MGEAELLALAATIPPVDEAAAAAAAARQARLTKPAGALGRLEELAVRVAGMRGVERPGWRERAVVVFAADHGVAAEGVSAYPSEVTPQMVASFARGTAAVSALARAAGARLMVVDVGVAGEVGDAGGSADGRLEGRPHPGPLPRGEGTSSRAASMVDPDHRTGAARVVQRRVRPGTASFVAGPAMARDEAVAAMLVGAGVVAEELARGVDLLALGEMGIGNSTAAAAVVAALLGLAPEDVVGRGTGVDDAGLRRKAEAVRRGLAANRPDPADPIGVLAAVGGLEIAALAGAVLQAAAARVPVLLDGYICGAAALAAARLAPAARAYLIAAHRSTEPGHRAVLGALGLEPLLDLGMRLGEASGATLALPIVVGALATHAEMATFEEAGVSTALEDVPSPAGRGPG